jgi:hypothetical protein
MTTINQALKHCSSVAELNALVSNHKLEADVGVMGGRRIKDASPKDNAEKKFTGTVSINDIVKCFKKVCKDSYVDMNSKDAQAIINKIKELDLSATLEVDRRHSFKKTLTEIKRFFGGKFDSEKFDHTLHAYPKDGNIAERFYTFNKKLSPEQQFIFEQIMPETYKAFKEALTHKDATHKQLMFLRCASEELKDRNGLAARYKQLKDKAPKLTGDTELTCNKVLLEVMKFMNKESIKMLRVI